MRYEHLDEGPVPDGHEPPLRAAHPAEHLLLSGIQKTFGTGETATLAIGNIDLAVREGEFLAIVGPSCRRRSKSEPPCRLNIEPGVEADVSRVGCG